MILYMTSKQMVKNTGVLNVIICWWEVQKVTCLYPVGMKIC